MSDNIQVLETIKKFGLLNYLQCLIKTNLRKIELYPVFPYTAAPNWSDKKEIILINNVLALVNVLKEKNNLN